MFALSRLRIGMPATAAAAGRLFLSKFIRTVLCAGTVLALVLVCAGGFVDHALAQKGKVEEETPEHKKTREANWNAALAEPPTLVTTPPPTPPKEIPTLPCATNSQKALLQYDLYSWQRNSVAFADVVSKMEKLEAEIPELQQKLRQFQQKFGRIPTAPELLAHDLLGTALKLAEDLKTLKEYQARAQEYREEAIDDSNDYDAVLNSIPKDCAPPQNQTAPQQPPANPPPAQPPTPPPRGGGSRFGPRPSVVMGPGGYVGGGGGVLATVCNDVNVTGVDSGGVADKGKAGGVPFCATAGFRASVYGGYNWSVGSRWIVGLEAETGYATNNTSGGIPGVSNAPGDSFSMREDWDGSLRARFGYMVAPNTLVYGTAGLALQHVSTTVACSSATPFPCGRFGPVTAFSATNAPVLVGGTIGAGVEYAITGNLRLRGEYRFSDYGTYNATYGSPANIAISTATQLRTNTGLLGLTYAFGGPPVQFSPSPLVTK